MPDQDGDMEGKKVTATCCTSNFQTRNVCVAVNEAPCLWPEIQTSLTGCGGFLSESADLNLSALSFLGPFPSCCMLWSF